MSQIFKQHNTPFIVLSDKIQRTQCSPTVCPQCALDPLCHSIYIKGHSASDFNIPVVYTKPAEATMYDDTIGIVRHFRGVADNLHPKPWIWVFDAEGLGMKHLLSTGPGLALARLFNENYETSLVQIYVLNPNILYRTLLTCIWPFLSTSMRSRIELL